MTFLPVILVVSSLLYFLPGTSAQSELITGLLFGNYVVGANSSVNACANASLNYCQNKNCSNGTFPVDGYTCIKPNGQPLQINYLSKELLSEAVKTTNSYAQTLGASIVSFNDIQVNLNADTVTYVFGLSNTITGLGQYALTEASGFLAPSIGGQLGVTINPERIVLSSPENEPVLSIEILFPTRAVTITWTSSTIGDLTTLRNALLYCAGLNASAPSAQIRLVTLVNQTTVIVKWIEDISQAPGVDKTYLSLGCLSFKELYNGSVCLNSTGFMIVSGTLTITGDSTCVIGIPVPVPVLPSPLPATQPHIGNSVSNSLSSAGLKFVLLHSLFTLILKLLF